MNRGAYSITFGTLVSAMLDLAKYWSWPQIWEVITFGIVPWALMVVINLMGVKVNFVVALLFESL